MMYQRVKDLREDNDLTQREIAQRLGQHLTTYQRWESGTTEIPAHVVVSLCDIYNVTADYILGIKKSLD